MDKRILKSQSNLKNKRQIIHLSGVVQDYVKIRVQKMQDLKIELDSRKILIHQVIIQKFVKEGWLAHLKSECSDLYESCQWAQQILISLKKYEGYPVEHYQREVAQCNNSVSNGSSVYISDTNKKLKKRDYDNQNNQLRYKRLYKQSDLIEEEVNASISLSSSVIGAINPMMGQNHKSSSVNSFSINHYNNKVSFSSINSNPSYVLPQYLMHKNEKHQNREQIDALELYVLKTNVISNHLQDPNNVLGHLFTVFFETFNNKYDNIAKQLHVIRLRNPNTPPGQDEQTTQDVISEIQQFIRVMQETIMLFYNINKQIKRSHSESKKNVPINHFTRENMLNFVTSQVFKNKKLYEIVFMFLQLDDLALEDKLKSSMKELFRKNPEDFYIQDRLCLNERTLKYYNKENYKQIKEEQENEFTGTESMNVFGEIENNLGSEIKQQAKIDQRFKSQSSLKEQNDNNQNKELQIKTQKQKKKQQLNIQQDDEQEEEEEEEKCNECRKSNEDDNTESTYQFSITQSSSPQKKNKTINQKGNNMKRNLTQEYLQKDSQNQKINNQIQNKQQNFQPQKKQYCKEVEHYRSSFENQVDMLNDNNLNNSQAQSYPYFSKNQLNRNPSEFNQSIKEKATEESLCTSDTSSQVEDEKESPSNINKNMTIQISSVTSDAPDKLYFERLKKESYYRSMKYIMMIQKQQSPIGKMKMIIKASEHILTSINAFYKNFGIQQNYYLDADDVLSIFSYFSCKSFIYNMNTHIRLISKFITSNLINSVSGYYLTTLTASLQNILEFQNGSILHQIDDL